MAITISKNPYDDAPIIHKIIAALYYEAIYNEGGYEAIQELKTKSPEQLMNVLDYLLNDIYSDGSAHFKKAIKIRYGCKKLFGISLEAKKMLMLDVYKELQNR